MALNIFRVPSFYVFVFLAVGLLVGISGLTGTEFIHAQFSGAPVISDVKIASVSANVATVKWRTNVQTDSLINYSINQSYGVVRDPFLNKTAHELVIGELEPSTTYHFRIISSDTDGNQGISGDFAFTTSGLSKISGIENIKNSQERGLAEKAISIVGKVTDPAALSLIEEQLKELAKGVTSELTIIGAPEVRPETTSAVVTWRTDRPSDSTVLFSPEDQYNSGSDNYAYSQNSTDSDGKLHEVEIIGLEPATSYHFQVVSKDKLGIAGRSEDYTFTTKALKPTIKNLRLLKVEESSATLAWDTTVPANTLVEYEDLTTGIRNTKGNPAFTTEHTLRVDDLKLGTQYRAIATSENQTGDKAISEAVTFITVKDEFKPVISKVSNESTIFPGAEARIQTIVSWLTDEPAKCQFNFRQGLVAGTKEESLPPQDDNLLEKHVQVITEFTPSTVYKFWVVCRDSSDNQARTEDFVLFTPEKEKSIVDVILENFEGTFGWVKDISG